MRAKQHKELITLAIKLGVKTVPQYANIVNFIQKTVKEDKNDRQGTILYRK